MRDYKQAIQDYLQRLKATIDELDIVKLNESANAIIDAIRRDANIYIFGNGGRAATASHFAGDFNKALSEKLGKKCRMICLCDNMALLMAIANDIGYEEIFRYQLDSLLREGDLVIGISGSGNSENVLRAVRFAKNCGNLTVGITGYDGGELRKISDLHMDVAVDDMQIAEDVHMMFDHMLVRVLGETIGG